MGTHPRASIHTTSTTPHNDSKAVSGTAVAISVE